MSTARNPIRLLHPRNRHQGRYDFAQLTAVCPALRAHLRRNPAGEPTIDFADAQAVRLLNQALLRSQYGIVHWELPAGYLCPPIPGRADYLHGLADLLAQDRAGVIPRGEPIRALDIGVGANCIYPLIAHQEYGWHAVGSDVDRAALTAAAANVQGNPCLRAAIELRWQPQRERIFRGVLQAGDYFALSLCNPPFHASPEEAAHGSGRKWHKLGRASAARKDPWRAQPALNFGGHSHELWCPGGELAFVRQMIGESREFAAAVGWFSSLIAKGAHLPEIYRELRSAGARAVHTGDMAQGNKQSRFVAWSFLTPAQRAQGGEALVPVLS